MKKLIDFKDKETRLEIVEYLKDLVLAKSETRLDEEIALGFLKELKSEIKKGS